VATTLCIRHLTGSLAGRTQRLELEETRALRLGRSPESDIRFTDEMDDCVSGTHAEVGLEDGRLFVEDKRSSNGTFVNGASCPPFQRLVVPDGSRLRLAREGPEMQLVLERSAAAQAPAGPAVPKEAVGRATLLREIDRAHQEERRVLANRVADGHRRTGKWVAATLGVVVLLSAGGLGGAIWWNRRHDRDLARQIDAAAAAGRANVWADVERQTGPAVAHIRCAYRIRIPVAPVAGGRTDLTLRGAVEGSGVLVRPGMLLTAKQVAEPWKSILPQWDELASRRGARASYERLDVQFFGQEPLAATLLASSPRADLALLQIRPNGSPVVKVAGSDAEIRVTDRIAVISYPAELDAKLIEIRGPGAGGGPAGLVETAPTLVLGTVAQPLATVAGAAYVVFDASSAYRSGGALLDARGRLLGIVSQPFTASRALRLLGEEIPIRAPGRAANLAVRPDNIRAFLRAHTAG
jgi:S1-C subfamily serine protease